MKSVSLHPSLLLSLCLSLPSPRLEVVVKAVESALQHLLDGLEQGVVDDVESLVQRVAGQLAQPAEEVHLHGEALQLIEVHIEQLQRAEQTQCLGQRVQMIALHDQDLQVHQVLDLVGNVLQQVPCQVQEDQAPHGVDTGGDVCDAVVTGQQEGQQIFEYFK